MTDEFATAMRRAQRKACASDPGAATAIIQSAPGGQGWQYPRRSDGTRCAALAEHRPAAGRARAAAVPLPAGPARKAGLCRSGLGMPDGLPGLVDLPGSAPARRDPVPWGGRVEMRRHSHPAGARDYRLFFPAPRAGGLAGLVIMLHGCTQTPEDFALGTQMDSAAQAAGFVVAYPGQTGQHNAHSCWNWFRPGDQTRSSGEPAMLADLATGLAREFELSGQAFVAGLSAGGAMAAILAETPPDLFRAVGIHSGLAAGSARDLPSALAAMRGQGGEGRAPRVPAIIFHGTADATVSPANVGVLLPGSALETRHLGGGRRWSRLTTSYGSELWLVDGAGRAWFGGDARGSYADPAGPEASAEMLRFFLQTKDRT